MISGHPISTGFLRLTGCQWDPRDRGVTVKEEMVLMLNIDESLVFLF